MSPEPVKTPSRRRLLLVGLVAVAIAGAVAANGIMQRARGMQEVAQWTNQQAVPTVQLAQIATSPAQQSLTLPGTIQPYAKAEIFARVSGYLHSWQQDIGAHVTAGQQLAAIDTPDLDQQLAQANANLATAQANWQLALVTAKRWQALYAMHDVSQQALDQYNSDASAKKTIVDAAQANVRQLQAMESFKTITAPFDGVVTARNTDVGALINTGNAGLPLFEVSDMDKVRIYVQLPQSYAADLHPGLQASFEMPQYPGQPFAATVATMSNSMDPNSRSMLVELQADNAAGKFLAGGYCLVHFQIPGDPNSIQLPATALLPADKGSQVALLGPDGKVVLKPIQIGRDFGDSVEVVSGLTRSDRVIDSPPETLQNGAPVQLAAAPAPANQLANAAAPTPPH
jgi:RND family efflux transporter MFP subunit